jgi:hypothetical protein
MISPDTEVALRELKSLSRELRMRCDEIAMAVDSISVACDESLMAGDGEVVSDVAFDKMQPATAKATESAERLRRDARLLDMRLEDIWLSLE